MSMIFLILSNTVFMIVTIFYDCMIDNGHFSVFTTILLTVVFTIHTYLSYVSIYFVFTNEHRKMRSY